MSLKHAIHPASVRAVSLLNVFDDYILDLNYHPIINMQLDASVQFLPLVFGQHIFNDIFRVFVFHVFQANQFNPFMPMNCWYGLNIT